MILKSRISKVRLINLNRVIISILVSMIYLVQLFITGDKTCKLKLKTSWTQKFVNAPVCFCCRFATDGPGSVVRKNIVKFWQTSDFIFCYSISFSLCGNCPHLPPVLKDWDEIVNSSKVWASKLKRTEAVFLVMLGTSSFPARDELFSCFPIYLVPSWIRARTQYD